MAPFAAPYGELLLLAVSAAVEAMLTIEPPPCSRMIGSTCLQTRNVPPAWTDIIRCQPSSVHSSIGPNAAWPAALRTQSMRPSCSRVDSTAATTDDSSATSAPRPMAPVDAGGDLLRLAGVEVDDGDPAAAGREPPRRGGGDPRATAGGEQHLALEVHG